MIKQRNHRQKCLVRSTGFLNIKNRIWAIAKSDVLSNKYLIEKTKNKAFYKLKNRGGGNLFCSSRTLP